MKKNTETWDGGRRRAWALGCFGILLLAACTREYYRKDADEEVSRLVKEKSTDPRWSLDNFTIEVDQRSRYHDSSDKDFPPRPPDDPVSHKLMQEVDGHWGYTAWDKDKNGIVDKLENPGWRKYLEEEMPPDASGRIKLRLEDALRLSLRHSPSYQQQLETLYLSALDVSTERYRFDLQFFGGFTSGFTHQGSQTPGGESNQVDFTPEASIGKRFATAGELLISFANSWVWEFFGPNEGLTSSRLSFSLVQPLLRGSGWVVALEQLTLAERTLLANLRAMQRYRQGYYTQVAIGDSGASGPQRRGGFFGGTGLTGFTGQGGGFGGVGDATGFGRGGLGGGAGGGGGGGGAGFAGGGAGTVGGFIGLLQQTQQIRNTQDSLNLQLRTLALLESNLDAGLIDIAQVDQFRQNIESERANLLQSQNSLKASLDTFNRSVLGLPPDMPLEPDDSLIRPFQLIDPTMTGVQDAIALVIDKFGDLPEQPDLEQVRAAFQQIEDLRRMMATQFDAVPDDIQRLEESSEAREHPMTEVERKLFEGDRKRLVEDLQALRTRFDETGEELEKFKTGLTAETIVKTSDGVVELLTSLSNIVGELSLIQARARLEMIVVDPINLSPEAALEIARNSRLDWMNNRAALVDSWRLIEFNANALESSLTLRLSGDVGTIDNKNPVKFRDDTATVRAGLEFDGPFTRLVERNNFRQQLISYQQDRRQLIQFEDGVHQGMRQLMRNLEQLRVNLEIQRRAVVIAIRRVDQTREALNRPVAAAAPGQAPQALGPTAAQNLLFALSDLRNTQNNLMSVWLNYMAERMRLYRELGLMKLDEQGLWVDEPLDKAIQEAQEKSSTGTILAKPLPPEVPSDWWTRLEMASAGPGGEGAAAAPAAATAKSPSPLKPKSENANGKRKQQAAN